MHAGDHAPLLSKEVQNTITKVLPSDDPLDGVEFDAIEFINR